MLKDANKQTGQRSGADNLAEALEVVLRFGIMLLRTGTTNFRVRQHMGALAHRLGIDRLEAHVTLTRIMATAYAGAQSCTLVSENTILGVNADRLSALELVTKTVGPGNQPQTVHAILDSIERLVPLHSLRTTAVAVGLACGGFCYLNGGGALECLISSVAAGIGQVARALLVRRGLNQFALTTLCAVLAASLYCAIVQGLSWAFRLQPNNAAGFMSSVLFLIPGFPLLTSLLDLIRLHFLSGLARITYATILLLAGAVGVCTVSGLAGLGLEDSMPVIVPEPLKSLFQVGASFLGGWGFSVLYNSTHRSALTVGLLAAIGNGLRLGLHGAGLGLMSATFLGALTVGLLSTPAAAITRKPRIALSIPGVIVMIPGRLAYSMIVLFTQGDVLPALREATLASFIVAAIALGLAAARLLIDKEWAFGP